MRIGNVRGTPGLLDEAGWLDIPAASGGRFADALAIFDSWDEFTVWAGEVADHPRQPYGAADLGAPVPLPRQVFGAGLNYHSHLAESGRPVPALPLFFTKFPTAIVGPYDDILVPTDMVDFEVELVVVMGRPAEAVRPDEAWSYVAGLTVGQDISARNVQRSGQLSMGKSFRTFGPTGPWLCTVDDFTDPTDLQLRCVLDGRVVQDARTSDMVFDVAELVAALSAVTRLLPGDLIFTGTPAGVGIFRTPPVFLRPGQVLESHIEGIGSLRNRCVESEPRSDMDITWRALAPDPGAHGLTHEKGPTP
jgi:2-keto-4-pentenoate hydratase/2-oxohepta-3-ene-1,7-dioic acid hydratase in catechol pathway